MKSLLTKLFVSIAVLTAALIPAIPAVVSAQTKLDVCEGVALTGTDCSDPGTDQKVNSTVELVINVLSFLVGIAAVIMIVIGGFRYVISAGDSANVTGAKNTILYAIIGLVIVALAQVIVRFVLDKAA